MTPRVIMPTEQPRILRSALPGTPRIVQPPASIARIVSAGTPGPQGERGLPGLPGQAGRVFFEHLQSQPAAVWMVSHGLGFRPSVTVTDTAGQAWFGAVQHTDLNNLTITFLAPFAGRAYCV